MQRSILGKGKNDNKKGFLLFFFTFISTDTNPGPLLAMFIYKDRYFSILLDYLCARFLMRGHLIHKYEIH